MLTWNEQDGKPLTLEAVRRRARHRRLMRKWGHVFFWLAYGAFIIAAAWNWNN
jgi:hypothetical protein